MWYWGWVPVLQVYHKITVLAEQHPIPGFIFLLKFFVHLFILYMCLCMYEITEAYHGNCMEITGQLV